MWMDDQYCPNCGDIAGTYPYECPVCSGKSFIECTTCRGDGKCTTCHGSGSVSIGGGIFCADCNGSGECVFCEGGSFTCGLCSGTGRVPQGTVFD